LTFVTSESTGQAPSFRAISQGEAYPSSSASLVYLPIIRVDVGSRTPFVGSVVLEPLISGGVGDAVEIPIQHLFELRFVGRGAAEEGHRRVQFLGVDAAEDVLGGR
jgi:hypothetical protein